MAMDWLGGVGSAEHDVAVRIDHWLSKDCYMLEQGRAQRRSCEVPIRVAWTARHPGLFSRELDYSAKRNKSDANRKETNLTPCERSSQAKFKRALSEPGNERGASGLTAEAIGPGWKGAAFLKLRQGSARRQSFQASASRWAASTARRWATRPAFCR